MSDEFVGLLLIVKKCMDQTAKYVVVYCKIFLNDVELVWQYQCTISPIENGTSLIMLKLQINEEYF
jgi:hypothetical protein